PRRASAAAQPRGRADVEAGASAARHRGIAAVAGPRTGRRILIAARAADALFKADRAFWPGRTGLTQPLLPARDGRAPRRDRARIVRSRAGRPLHCGRIQGPLLYRPQFVTVDPERDRGVVLNEFTAAFDKRVLGLSGSREQIAAAAEALGIEYRNVLAGNEDYVIDHSSVLSLIGTDRRNAVTFAFA